VSLALTARGKAAGLFGIAVGLFAAFGGLGLPLASALCALLGGTLLVRDRQWRNVFDALRRKWLIWLSLIAFWIWALASVSWSASQDAMAQGWVLLGLALICPMTGWALAGAGDNHTVARRAVIAGVVLCLVTLGFEAINGYTLSHLASPQEDVKAMERNLGRGAVIALSLIWPALVALWWETFNKRAVIVLLGIGLFLSTRFGFDLNLIALVLAGLGGLIALKAPKLMLNVIGLGTALGILLAPIIYPLFADFVRSFTGDSVSGLSYERRAQMWEFAVSRILEKPLTGWGLDGASQFDAVVRVGGFDWTQLQRHPHSAPLHIWLELGGVGAAILSFSVALSCFLAARRFAQTPLAASALVGGLVTIILSWALSFGAWEEWIWIVLTGVIGICLGLRRFELLARQQLDRDARNADDPATQSFQ
jgi:O-antigen ligase